MVADTAAKAIKNAEIRMKTFILMLTLGASDVK